MPRPKPLTDEIWEERCDRRLKREEDARRRVDEPTESDIEQDMALAAKLVGILGGTLRAGRGAQREDIITKFKRELVALLGEIRWEWESRKEIEFMSDPSLPEIPVIGGVQPTPGEMRATLIALARTDKKRRAYSSAKVLIRWAAAYKPQRGRREGRRAVAQWAARYLFEFMQRHALGASTRQRRKFVFVAMRGLGVDTPDLENDPGDYNIWFDEAETLATKPST